MSEHKDWKLLDQKLDEVVKLKARVKELERKPSRHETTINCWFCGKSQSLHQHTENDGFCVRCDAVIELGLG